MARFKKVKNVNLPIIQIKPGKEVYLKLMKPMYKGKKIDEIDPNTGNIIDKPPVDLLDVVDLECGEEGTIVVATVLGEIFNEEYDPDELVGRCFSIMKHAKKDGKKYHQYTVCEIEVTEEDSDDDE